MKTSNSKFANFVGVVVVLAALALFFSVFGGIILAVVLIGVGIFSFITLLKSAVVGTVVWLVWNYLIATSFHVIPIPWLGTVGIIFLLFLLKSLLSKSSSEAPSKAVPSSEGTARVGGERPGPSDRPRHYQEARVTNPIIDV